VENATAYVMVGLGSALGGVGRFWLSGMVAQRIGENFPWGTIAVNVSGSCLIGFLAALVGPESRLHPKLAQFLLQFFMVGLCGGYTTFSSFSIQTLNLAREAQWLYAGYNALLSFACCLVAVWLGYLLGQLVSR
jgi:CrcB protein